MSIEINMMKITKVWLKIFYISLTELKYILELNSLLFIITTLFYLFMCTPDWFRRMAPSKFNG